MPRTLVAGIQFVFALALGRDGLLLLLQAQLNTAWEEGFYHTISLGTTLMLIVSLLALLVGALQLACSIGFVRGHRWAAFGTLSVSSMLMLMLPSPFHLVMGLSAGVALYHSLPPPPPPEEDEEDDEL